MGARPEQTEACFKVAGSYSSHPRILPTSTDKISGSGEPLLILAIKDLLSRVSKRLQQFHQVFFMGEEIDHHTHTHTTSNCQDCLKPFKASSCSWLTIRHPYSVASKTCNFSCLPPPISPNTSYATCSLTLECLHLVTRACYASLFPRVFAHAIPSFWSAFLPLFPSLMPVHPGYLGLSITSPGITDTRATARSIWFHSSWGNGGGSLSCTP